MNFLLIFVFISAFLIRLIGINQSLWLDEAIVAKVVRQFDYFSIIKQFSPFDFHPPLYYLLIKLWTNFFGYSEISLRIPSVIFSLATGYFIYLIGKLIRNKKFAFWAVLFFLFNPLIIYYSQEARMYLMTTFLLTGQLYFLLKILKRQNSNEKIQNQNILFFEVFLFLSLLTFYGSIFLIVSFLLIFFFKKQYRYFFLSLFSLFFSLIIIAPLLYHQLTNAKILTADVTNWSIVLGKANLKNFLLIPVKFSVGRIDFYPKWVYYLISGSWTLILLTLLFKNLILKIRHSIKTKSLKFEIILYYLLIFPLVLGFLATFVTPLLQYFRFLYLIPIMAILLSLSDDFSQSFLFLGFFVFSMIYLLNPQFYREDWRSLGRNLSSAKPIYMILSSSDPLLYYRPDLKVKDLRSINNNNLEEKIYIIPYTAAIYGFSYDKILTAKDYQLTRKRIFHRLLLEEWEKTE